MDHETRVGGLRGLKILFDQGVPAPTSRQLPEHVVDTAFERGWSNLRNCALLDQLERYGNQFLVTTHQDLCPHQIRADRRLAITELVTTTWTRFRQRVYDIRAVDEKIGRGQHMEVSI